MPICMAKAWRLYFLLSFVVWLCITHQRSHWLPQGDFVYLNDCLPAFMTVHQSISHFVSQSINQSRARQSVSKSLSCFINQSISWSVSHSIGCFVSQSVRQSFIMLVSQSGSQLSFRCFSCRQFFMLEMFPLVSFHNCSMAKRTKVIW